MIPPESNSAWKGGPVEPDDPRRTSCQHCGWAMVKGGLSYCVACGLDAPGLCPDCRGTGAVRVQSLYGHGPRTLACGLCVGTGKEPAP